MPPTRVLECKSNTDHYEARAVLVQCIDHRFHQANKDFAKKFYPDSNLDFFKIAGGARPIANKDNNGHHFMLDQVVAALKLHCAPEVALMVHKACGAYGKLPDGTNEDSFLINELQKARVNLKEHLSKNGFEEIKIRTYIADFEGFVETFDMAVSSIDSQVLA
jgi:hypothetical protein